MLIAIRISGLVDMSESQEQALYRIRLRRKYTAILLRDTKENQHTLNQLRNFIAFGKIDEATLKELIEKRGQPLNKKKIDSAKIVSELGKKTLDELGLKPFFRLHPPIGGIDSKIHFGRKKGVLGDNKEKINDLLRRML